MATQLAPLPVQRFYDNNNNPLAGGFLYTYQAGTTTPFATYTDSTGGTANTNPVLLNARGEASVWLNPAQAYKFVLEDAFNNVIWTSDNLTAPAPIAVGNMTDEHGSGGIGFAANVDFTPGVTTSLTLSQGYGIAANIWVAFDSAEQGADSYTLSGQSLTFNAPIPAGVNKVFVKGGTVLSLGTPGAGTVGDSQIAWSTNILNRVCDSIAALGTLNIGIYKRAFVTGYYAPGDGGGGNYSYSASTSQSNANGGTIIAAAGGIGCWLLQQTTTVSLKQFGAKGDGTTDDTAAITNCVNAVLDVFVPQGLYQHTAITITGRNSLTIRGVGGFYNAQFRGTVTGFGFSFVGCTNIELRDLTFTAANGVTAVGGVQIDTASNIQVYKCLFYAFTGPGLQHNGISATPISGCVLKDSFFLSCGTDGTSPQFYAVYSNDFMYTDNQFGSISPFSLANRPAIGVHLSNCSNGFYGDNLIWECGQGMIVDNVAGTASLYNRIIGNRFEQCQQQGFYSIGSAEMIFTNNWVNNNSLASSGAYANALFDSTINSVIQDNQSYDWGGGGGHRVQYNFAFQNVSTNNIIGNNKCAFWNVAPYGATADSVTNAWDSPASFASIAALAAAQTQYLGPGGMSSANSSPQIAIGKKQALYLELRLSVAPGVGQNVQATLFVNGAGTSQNIVVSGTNTSGIFVAPVTLNDGDEYSVQVISSASAASTIPRCRVAMANT